MNNRFIQVFTELRYCTYQMIALLMEIIPTCLELHVGYNWQAMVSNLSPRYLAFSFGSFFDFSHNNCVYSECGMYSQATPGLQNMCVTARLQ